MPIFTFDPVEHRYFLDGVQIPGVTAILKVAGLVPNYAGFAGPQYRGMHVHLACEYLDLNDLDWSSVHTDYLGYVQAWDRFKKESGFVAELIEYQTFHPALRFAGTLDRRGRMGEFFYQLDLKTGDPAAWWGLQTAGYRLLKPEWKNDKRASVQVCKDGTYKLHLHEDRGDEAAFMAALALWHWKANKGVKNGSGY